MQAVKNAGTIPAPVKKRPKTELPDYTRGEEIMNMVSHIVGGAFGITALALMVVFAAIRGDGAWGIVSASIYGTTLVIMFTVSSIYHGLYPGKAKRVMRIIDHCDIYFLIAGTYTPILLVGIRPVNPGVAWSIFGVEWALTALAVTLNAIDLKRFEKISMACYIGMGWCVIVVLRLTISVMTVPGFMLLLSGGIAFTVGAVLYKLGKKIRYMHSLFHLFVVAGCVLQFFAIFFYIL